MSEAWTCKAQPTAVVPSDCNHPFCGCDPHAEGIIEALQECGWGPDHDHLRARVAELEEDKKNLLGIVDSCHKKIAELNTKITGLERKQCDCGMKS